MSPRALGPRKVMKISGVGDSGGSLRSALALAERVCRAADRVDTARMPGPRDRLSRTGSASDLAIILRLLRPFPHSSVVGQRHADSSRRSASRTGKSD